MRVVDVFCGIGGFSCGAMSMECSVEGGIDNENRVLRAWAANTAGQATCATVGKEDISWPEAAPDLHVHFSPPCTAISKARCSAPQSEVDDGLDMIRLCLDVVVDQGYANWSLENVSTVATRALLDEHQRRHPDEIAHATLDAADFGTPQTRARLIASTPKTIKFLKEQPVHRVSVANAFAASGITLPATHIKSTTNNRDGTPCVRSVHQAAFCVTASHPLTWCKHDGTTVRTLTAAESAALQGFPKSWLLPPGSRAGIRAAGNAIPPPFAAAIVRAALSAAGLDTPHTCRGLSWASEPTALTVATCKRKRSPVKGMKALKRRVSILEALVCSMQRV